jgi:hypothetical protein
VLQGQDLGKFTGTYSSGDLPFKVVCTRSHDKLVFQAGEKTMEAEAVTANYFMNLPTGSFFEFNVEKSELYIKETDNTYYLKKEKQD